jgi:hypothetical protein
MLLRTSRQKALRKVWRLRRPEPLPDAIAALAALARAWVTTTIAIIVLIVTLEIAPFWDGTIYLQELGVALTIDPQLPQPIVEPSNDPQAEVRSSP